MSALTEELALKKSRARNLRHIKTLNCWGCKLEDVAIVEQIPNLEVIGLSGNCVTTLKCFQSCTNLKEVYIRRNNISDLTEVAFLANLQALRVLWMSENPVSSMPGYRDYVIKALPKLVRLDNEDVTETERERVKSLSLEDILAQAGKNATTDAGQEQPPSQQPTTTSEPHQTEVDSNVCKAVLCLLGELSHRELLAVKDQVEQLLSQDQK